MRGSNSDSLELYCVEGGVKAAALCSEAAD